MRKNTEPTLIMILMPRWGAAFSTPETSGRLRTSISGKENVHASWNPGGWRRWGAHWRCTRTCRRRGNAHCASRSSRAATKTALVGEPVCQVHGSSIGSYATFDPDRHTLDHGQSHAIAFGPGIDCARDPDRSGGSAAQRD